MLLVKHEASRAAKHAAFPYQREAVRAVRDLEYAAIFHEQGLGKTKIGIDLALTWLEAGAVDSVLFVTKKSLVKNWSDEMQFHTHFKPRIIGQDKRQNYFAFNSPARIYVAHYEAIQAEKKRLDVFLRTRRVAIICDEAQKFKNPDGAIASVLCTLAPAFTRRVVMTGTPVANRPYDIWALVRFLDGGKALGADFKRFKAEYDLTDDVVHDDAARTDFEERLASLFDRIRPFCVRETKASSGVELPEKTIVDVPVDLDGRQAEMYQLYRDELRSVVLRDGVLVTDDAESIVKRLLRLIQVASNPRLVDQSYRQEPGKLPVLDGLLSDALNSDPSVKAIVWTSFTENVGWLARELKRFGPAQVHGQLAISDRNAAIDRFKHADSCRLLIATPGAAKEGLTLTVANHAVFFDRSLSLDDYLQAQDRIHRISQTRECVIYNLIARDTVDEWVDELLAAKEFAAKLALHDINTDQYRTVATYDFANTLRRILGDESVA